MKIYMLLLLLITQLFMLVQNSCCSSRSDVPTGYTFTLAIPPEYTKGFSGKAYLMETDQMPLNFRMALSVDAIDGRYACSLQVFLGNVKVWNSGHRSEFYTSEICVLELTMGGDLRLKGRNDVVGWRTGTPGQGVEKLQLLDSGNLVVVDGQEHIKWQTFNFPTNVLLEGQRLSVATHLISFPTSNNTLPFFSFEIQHDKVALYLNSGSTNKSKYSYWEFQPSKGRNITFIELSSRGLELFDDKFENFTQINSHGRNQVRFLSLDSETGNLGLYYYSPYKDKFEASLEVLNSTCDLPFACSPYGICRFSNTCSCISSLTREEGNSTDCGKGVLSNDVLCEVDKVEMLELESAGSLLQSTNLLTNISKTKCANTCLNDCGCYAALYKSIMRECMIYDIVRGVKQVKRGSGLSYLVKVPKISRSNPKKRILKKWLLVFIVFIDGLILFLLLGALFYFIVWKRRRRTADGTS